MWMRDIDKLHPCCSWSVGTRHSYQSSSSLKGEDSPEHRFQMYRFHFQYQLCSASTWLFQLNEFITFSGIHSCPSYVARNIGQDFLFGLAGVSSVDDFSYFTGIAKKTALSDHWWGTGPLKTNHCLTWNGFQINSCFQSASVVFASLGNPLWCRWISWVEVNLFEANLRLK